MDYTNWASGEPKTGKSCAYMNPNNGKWASENCDAGSTAFICKHDVTIVEEQKKVKPTVLKVLLV